MDNMRDEFAKLARKERHRNVAETRYWCEQYRLFAERLLQEHIRQLEAERVPEGFLSDAMTAAGLVAHGKQDKVLSERLRIGVQAMLAAATAKEQTK